MISPSSNSPPVDPSGGGGDCSPSESSCWTETPAHRNPHVKRKCTVDSTISAYPPDNKSSISISAFPGDHETSTLRRQAHALRRHRPVPRRPFLHGPRHSPSRHFDRDDILSSLLDNLNVASPRGCLLKNSMAFSSSNGECHDFDISFGHENASFAKLYLPTNASTEGNDVIEEPFSALPSSWSPKKVRDDEPPRASWLRMQGPSTISNRQLFAFNSDISPSRASFGIKCNASI